MPTKTRAICLIALMSMLVTSCAGIDTTDSSEPSSSTTAGAVTTTTLTPETTTTSSTETIDHEMGPGSVEPAELAAANLAAAAFQDVSAAEAAGYESTMETLGCFQNPEEGGMGLHYLNDSILDATPDASAPEALVYELNANGEIAGLVAHEYIVPIEAWTEDSPPSLFGLEFHQHPVLPLWIMHAWIWKVNPMGTFNEWNPTVRQCPQGIPIFGVDLP